MPTTHKFSPFQRTSTVFLIYNLLVILWGAWVRISFSGDGCGESWPLCEGQVVPVNADKAQWIEWSHRASTGIFGLWALTMLIWAMRQFAKKHPVRRYAVAMLMFTISEALVGAALVKLGLVAQNQSITRAWVMGFHQINSLALTGSIFMMTWRATPAQNTHFSPSVAAIFVAFGLVSFTGAIAALAGTLYPSMDLVSGIIADLNSNSPLLIRLRLSHPLLASTFCVGIILWLVGKQRLAKNKKTLLVVIAIAFAIGTTTLVTLSPTVLKLVHLLVAHVVCVALLYGCLGNQSASARS